MFQTILDILYPVRCPVCNEIVIPKGEKICKSCKEKLVLVTEPCCKRCGKPIEVEEKEYCSDCVRKEYHFVRGYSVWVYNAIMKKSIAEFKYHNKKEYAKFYVQEIVFHYGDIIKKLSPDALVPVPIHRLKYKERGFNQADLLARGIAKELKIPVLSHLLIRNKKTVPQKQLNDKERLRNLRKAFDYNHIEEKEYQGKIERVLLVDDIYTTGSTIEACTNVLNENGVNSVYFITLCIGKGY